MEEKDTSIPCPYVPLSHHDNLLPSPPAPRRRSARTFILMLACAFLSLAAILALFLASPNNNNSAATRTDDDDDSCLLRRGLSRGVSAGVSEKTNNLINLKLGAGEGECESSYPWTNSMLSWQRTAFHFQPENNWMNDPNGPLFYKGWYHLFYQYNPNAAVWGDIVWGHAVSRDLIHWLYLPLAMVPDQWYDINGVWTGSATFLEDGTLVMLYTGSTDKAVQVQNLAYPANLSDPLLLEWVKYSGNPVLVPPPGIGLKDFRDPTTAWLTPEGKWRITIGSKLNKTGIALLYDTVDFKNYEQIDGYMHTVPGTGMWECVDFYPVSKTSQNGLDTSTNGPEVKHVLKASMDDTRIDYYAIGTYDDKTNKWKPDFPELDVGYGLRYDYGKFYASKTFYDQNKGRRILWGWIGESDSEYADVSKGWSSLQGVPRTVLLDQKTGANLLQWPVEEVESLRLGSQDFTKTKVSAGAIIPLHVGDATQLDIVAEFEVNGDALESTAISGEAYECGTSGGSAQRGALGPFGILVLSDASLVEQTPVYFYIVKGSDRKLRTFFCADQSRSSVASDVDKHIYGSFVPVLEGEKLTMRILVRKPIHLVDKLFLLENLHIKVHQWVVCAGGSLHSRKLCPRR
uniref:beta-fructofuranosidase n=1 Tax=Kalanchoe fedtschenkoi TaxID=63787 RepID=A0A7N0VAE6_KALFE